MGPGAMLWGVCRVGRGAFIGAGAIVKPEIQIGENAVIGVGPVITRDVPANTLVFGSPGRIIREGIAGHNNVGV